MLYKFVKTRILKKYFLQYKPFLVFLAKFLGSYAVLIFVYNAYLKSFDANKFEADGFTKMVAAQSGFLLKNAAFDFELGDAKDSPSVVFYVRSKAFVRIVEGCNALSVMILFVAFVLAFRGKFWTTGMFLIVGLLTIHVLNISRIALLTAGMFYYPEFKTLLHDVVFPLFIYGVVFGLWVLWVNKFSDYAKSF